jgi:beta-1,4-mannosyl-glycoprotein beta-1,4-N-acetylglucosaminyltransferase
MSRKIIECMPFFNELDLLEMRLEITSDYVDYWVISESDKTFSEIEKPLYLKDNLDSRFSKFKDRIIRVEYECKSGPWWNEFGSRNCLGEYVLKNFDQDDLIVLADCDEIPDYRKIDFNSHFPAIIETRGYYYYLNCKQTEDFRIVSIFPVSCLNEIETYRMRACAGMDVPVIENAGWHWSFLGGAEKISEKIKAYAHQDLNIDEYSSISKIEEKLENLTDIFNRGIGYSIVDIDESYPDYIIKNQDKLKKYIIKK